MSRIIVFILILISIFSCKKNNNTGDYLKFQFRGESYSFDSVSGKSWQLKGSTNNTSSLTVYARNTKTQSTLQFTITNYAGLSYNGLYHPGYWWPANQAQPTTALESFSLHITSGNLSGTYNYFGNDSLSMRTLPIPQDPAISFFYVSVQNSNDNAVQGNMEGLIGVPDSIGNGSPAIIENGQFHLHFVPF